MSLSHKSILAIILQKKRPAKVRRNLCLKARVKYSNDKRPVNMGVYGLRLTVCVTGLWAGVDSI